MKRMTETQYYFLFCKILIIFFKFINNRVYHRVSNYHFLFNSFPSFLFKLFSSFFQLLQAGGGNRGNSDIYFDFFQLYLLYASSIISSVNPFFLRNMRFCVYETFQRFLPSKKIEAIEISFSFSSIFLSYYSSCFFFLASLLPIRCNLLSIIGYKIISAPIHTHIKLLNFFPKKKKSKQHDFTLILGYFG